ncbi:MAG: IS21 family transposase, partial [Deltaproteobacteria bacterium]|nr:IS21 family transposase [Deltaproteobacteria bacterium]
MDPRRRLMEPMLWNQIKHLYDVEKLSIRQIANKLRRARKTVARVIHNERVMRSFPDSMLRPYERLIDQWYQEYPFLKASQVYERLRSYGFKGSYGTVSVWTQRYRQKKRQAYHELTFLPGEEAQVDWIEERLPWGVSYGFGMILAYSRYLYVRFYPRQNLEFFLEGHMEAYREMIGVAHRHRYDNIKTVVIERSPQVKFNAQFLDFARHFGFSIHLCNPYRANEKGRIERALRDLRDFLRVNTFQDLKDLNRKVGLWRIERNQRIHRSTQKAPIDALKEEKLKTLPAIPYRPYRVVLGSVTKTGFVEFETNRYSVPSSYAERSCEIFAYPDHLEVMIKANRIALHRRSFGRKEKIEDPTHRETLLRMTPQFKSQRIYQLIHQMDPA